MIEPVEKKLTTKAHFAQTYCVSSDEVCINMLHVIRKTLTNNLSTVVPLYNAVFGMNNFAQKIRVVQGDRAIQGIL